MARLPAHEIEALVETSIRKNIEEICKDLEHHIITYVVKNQNAISSFDLVRQCVTKVTISMDQITVSINPLKLTPLLKKHLNIDVNIGQKALDIAEPYQTRRAQKGAVIIESSKKKDALDLPPDKLKKLIQGIIWRDEHFAGASMSDIAQRENCSDSYVRKTIVYSFDTLENI